MSLKLITLFLSVPRLKMLEIIPVFQCSLVSCFCMPVLVWILSVFGTIFQKYDVSVVSPTPSSENILLC
jgi:hypothetical protein